MYLLSTVLSIYSLSRVLVTGFNKPEMFRVFREAEREPRLFSFFQCGTVGFTLVPTSLSVFLYISVLFFAQQLRNILLNVTVVERMQISQLQKRYPHRVIPRPYDLGMSQNFHQLAKLSTMDGINYPVKSGTDEHALLKLVLRERDSMLRKKHVKKHAVVKGYGGTIMPLSHGCATMMSAPVTESRLPVEPGDEIYVSRREGLWAYGHNTDTAQSGWLPQDCVQEVGPPRAGGGGQPVGFFADHGQLEYEAPSFQPAPLRPPPATYMNPQYQNTHWEPLQPQEPIDQRLKPHRYSGARHDPRHDRHRRKEPIVYP